MTTSPRLARGLLVAALFVGALPRIDAVSRRFGPDRDQRTDVMRYYASMAESALAGRGWLPSYPTNFVPPPGQAFFIYSLKRLWPTADFQHMRSVQALVSIATILLGYAAGRALSGAWCGVVCAWLLALNGRLSEMVGTLVPETNFVFSLFAAVVVALSASRRESLPLWISTGALLGVGALFKPTALLLPGAIAVLLVAAAPRRRHVWHEAGCLVLAAAMVVAPWVVRNRLHYGAWLPISTNGGTLLALANAPGLDAARADMVYWDDLYRRDYYQDPEIETRWAGVRDGDGKLEENQKDAAYRQRALAYMAAQPGHFARNYALKLRNFVFSAGDERVAPVLFGINNEIVRLTVFLGAAGTVVLLFERRARREARLVVVVSLYFLLSGALYHLTRDGRMDLFWKSFVSLPAGVAVTAAAAALRRWLAGLASSPTPGYGPETSLPVGVE